MVADLALGNEENSLSTDIGPDSNSLEELEAGLVKLREESKELPFQHHEVEATGSRQNESSGKAMSFGAVAHAADAIPSSPALRGLGSTGSQLEAIRSAEAMLTSENANLRRQLHRWRTASAAEHQANSAEVLKSSEPAGGSSQHQEHVSLLASTVQTVFNTGQVPLDGSANAIRLMLIFVCVNAAMFFIWRTSESDAKVPTRLMHPILRAMGFNTLEVEASELQVCNLPSGGAVFASIQLGSDQETCTNVAERPSSGLVQFQEPLKCHITGSSHDSQMCVFRIRRADVPSQDTVAFLQLSTEDLMRRVRSKHGQQYFNFNLHVKEQMPHGLRPQLGMRLREVSETQDFRWR